MDQPDRDSLALNSQVAVKGNITLLGIFTPMYARKLVENELAMIVKKEMEKVKWDVNKPEAIDTTSLNTRTCEAGKADKEGEEEKKIELLISKS